MKWCRSWKWRYEATRFTQNKWEKSKSNSTNQGHLSKQINQSTSPDKQVTFRWLSMMLYKTKDYFWDVKICYKILFMLFIAQNNFSCWSHLELSVILVYFFIPHWETHHNLPDFISSLAWIGLRCPVTISCSKQKRKTEWQLYSWRSVSHALF